MLRNFGWLLRSQAETTDFTAKRFAAREDVANAPQLIINYMPSLPLHIDPPTLSGDQFQFQFQARANKSYVVERRALADTGSWTVVTNIPIQTVAGAVLVTDTVGSENAFYHVVEL